MDLKTYEQTKFELAELIRSAQLMATENDKDPQKQSGSEQPWCDLLIRLAEDRFTVVVAGRFNRGKSSLMNAVLGIDRLPTGVVPLTSVITYVRYGTSERVLLEYYGGRLRGEAKLEDLPQLVTEKGNPGNVKGIRAAEIQLPAEILRRGFFFVDTPGLGSAIFENSQTTERFIREIDVLILVTGYESPLTEDEIHFLRQASASVRAVFVVVNKHDQVCSGARQEVLEYVAKTAQTVLNGKISKLFSVSARDGLAAKQANDMEAQQASGILGFEEELVRFLTAERSRLFLSAMCDRALAQIESLPEANLEHLSSRLTTLRRQQVDGSTEGERNQPESVATGSASVQIDSRGVTPCDMCRGVMHQVLEFLRQYQYELSTRPETQEQHAQQGGFCPQHTWHYEQVASPRGICTSYPRLLNAVARKLRSMAENGSAESGPRGGFMDHSCSACKVRWETEDKMARSIVLKLQAGKSHQRALPALCLPHLELLLRDLDDKPVRQNLLLREAVMMERTAEDMQRYAIKHDALRRHLVSKEEKDAPLLGLQLLTGHRNVNAIFTIRDIL
jgi:GTP-binding protein EngB required for normal cell division